MKRKNLVLAVGVAFVMCAQSFTTLVGAIATTETELTPVTKIIVSAYGWEYVPPVKDDTGKTVTPEQRWLTYIQLFNSGDTPINLANMSLRVETLDNKGIQDCTPSEKCMQIDMPKPERPEQPLYLAPGKHVLLASNGSVDGSRYQMNDFLLPIYQKSTIPWFRILVSETAKRSLEAVAKLDSRADATHEYADWLRNENSSGTGYYEGFTALGSAPSLLFDDPLYVVPASPTVTIDEVFPSSLSCEPYADNPLCYDYIKIHVDENVDLSKYVLRTDTGSLDRTSSNSFWLGAYAPNTDGYVRVFLNDDDEPFNLVNQGYVWLEDIYGLRKYSETMVNYGTQGSPQTGWSWMLPDSNAMGWSVEASPLALNRFMPYVAPAKPATVCPEGKYLNPETGRCRTVEEAVNALAACAEGQERNPLTNRCRKIETASTSLTPCGEGQERNPLTNRCRSIASAVAELLPCDEGYERNPATNRCRKVLGASSGTSSSYDKPVNPVGETKATESPWGWVTAGMVGLAALGYAAYEWRSELAKAGAKFASRFKKV